MSKRRVRDLGARGAVFGSVALAFFLGGLPARAQNLLQDPQFEQGVGGFVPAFPGTILRSAALGPDGAPGIGNLRMLGPGFAIARACVPVVGGRTYSWGGTLRSVSGGSWIALYFFADGTCQNPSSLSNIAGPVVLPPSSWQFVPSADATAPLGASSVSFTIIATVPLSTEGGADIDNVYLGPQGTSAPGLGVPALSWPLAMLLAAVLAMVGLRALKPA